MQWLKNIFGRGTAVKRRKRDGSVLGDAITKGIYRAEAGAEPTGHFDPKTAPFRMYPFGEVHILCHPNADKVISMMRDQSWENIGRLALKQDTAIDLALALDIPTTEKVLQTFERMTEMKDVVAFLMDTTVLPFFDMYSITGQFQRTAIPEVAHELILNSLANLLLNGSDFKSVRSVGDFRIQMTQFIKQSKQGGKTESSQHPPEVS